MPAVLHWFKWEAMITWASGIVLLAVVYYLTGGIYLLDADSTLNLWQAVPLSISLILVSWKVYDLLWISPLGKAGWPATLVSFLLLGGLMLFLDAAYSSRASFIHVGAILGTIMVANVWERILPAQQKMIDATREGRQPDFELGKAAKRRSMHNSYVTLPVLFIMLSNHFPGIYGSRWNVVLLALLIVAGAAARHVMIARGRGRMMALAGTVASIASVVALSQELQGVQGVGVQGEVTFGQARAIINARCVQCHSQWPTDDVFTVAPNGVTFDSPEDIEGYANRIADRAVVQRTMPLANKTGMTEAERGILGRWIDAGALLR